MDDHLAQALAGAHDIGRIYSLIRGDQHEAFTAMHHGGVSCFIGAERVVFDRFARRILHQWYVFVSSRVINDLRPVRLEQVKDPPAVPYRPDQYPQIQLRMLLLQLLLNIINVVFVDIKNDQAARPVIRDLPAELAADGATAARDQNGLPFNLLKDPVHIGLNGFPA